MKRIDAGARRASKGYVCLLLLGLLLLTAGRAAAQLEDPDSPRASESDPALSGWQFFQEIQTDTKTGSQYFALSVPPEVFGKARPDLSDLRMADARGVRVPYAKRELSPQHRQTPMRIVRQFDEGVNVTLGLPIIRTSPDHGTAFDIAGQGKADPGAMAAAIRMAAQMAEARARNG